jgi:hypothetical protein
MPRTPVYLEEGKRRVFAGAIHWPGWCRSGRDEDSALEALLASGPRYKAVIARSVRGFTAPSRASALEVVERLPGDATTDFGAPGAVPASDQRPLDAAETKRLGAILRACWRAFDRTAEAAAGRALRKGPRGGGRELDAIVRHVVQAEQSYLRQLGGKYRWTEGADATAETHRLRRAVLATLTSGARGELPAEGPRSGKRWPPRYFVRRAAWHVLDHAWEIEDRAE